MSSAVTITMNSAHSPTFPSLHLRHNSFSNPSVALPKSQLILQPFRCFTYVTVHYPTLLFRFFCVTSSSLNSPGEPPMNRGRMWPKFPTRKLTRLGIEPWPAARKLTNLPLNHNGGHIIFKGH